MPLLTIITVVLNNRQGLSKTFASIKEQTFNNYEWVIIDGASTDGTAEDALQLQSPSVNVVTEQDHGVYFAMNKGLERSRGLFVMFLNAGDTFVSRDTLEKLQPFLKLDTLDFIYGDSLQWIADRQLYKAANGHRKIRYGMFGCHQAMYYRRSVIGKMHYDTRFKVSADYDFTARFLKKTINITRVPEALCIYDIPNISLRFRNKGRRENWVVQRDILKVSFLNRIFIYLISCLMSWLRQYFPRIYKFLQNIHFFATSKA